LKRSSLAIPLALALAGAMAISGSVEASTAGTRSSAAANGRSASTVVGAPAPTLLRKVTRSGLVMMVFANGNFRIFTGKRFFRIVMKPRTHVVNLLGKEIPRTFIQVPIKVWVTGWRKLSTITATKVIVNTRKDAP
jgi:hypothetical protein